MSFLPIPLPYTFAENDHSHPTTRPLQLQTSQPQAHPMLTRSSRSAPRSNILVNKLLRAARDHNASSGASAHGFTKEPADLTNSRKKRKAVLTEEVKEKRKQTKTLEPAQKQVAPRSASNELHGPQSHAGAVTMPPPHHPQKKRRQIVQLYDA